jgi:hypothetical protein
MEIIRATAIKNKKDMGVCRPKKSPANTRPAGEIIVKRN